MAGSWLDDSRNLGHNGIPPPGCFQVGSYVAYFLFMPLRYGLTLNKNKIPSPVNPLKRSEMTSNPFVLEASEYRRDIRPVPHYIEQASHFLHVSTGKPLNECTEYVKRVIRNNVFGKIRNPKVSYLLRQDNGDRIREETTLTKYIAESMKTGQIMAPTFTCYSNPSEKQSLLVSFVEANIKARSVLKKAEQAAKAAGDKNTAAIKGIGQTNKKLSNNSLSGAHVSNSTPLYNPTAHSSLTSNCRTTSGYGNANNEKLMSGNRHYWNPHLVINNINCIIYLTDRPVFEAMMAKYNLHVPTPEETMECILYSTRLYWIDDRHEQNIRNFVLALEGWQRAAFVYTGDLYHVKKHNDAFMREFFYQLSMKTHDPVEDAVNKVWTLHEDYLNLAHQICSVEMRGRGKDYKAIAGTETLNTLVSTGLHIHKVVDEYRDFIRAIFVTANMPASVGYFPNSIRRAALTSDTDSTIFTVQDWVQWYQGHIDITPASNALSATAIFLASQGIVHVLAKMSANFGVEEKRIFQTAMKNEFKFDVFVPTQVAKHYYAQISCQEGNILKDLDTEIKGVHLKNSNVPKFITKQAKELMEWTMGKINKNEKISIKEVFKMVGDVERQVIAYVREGNPIAFKMQDIKRPDAYKNPEVSPYERHLFWQETFACKYGEMPEPPYACLKVSTTLVNPTAVKEWLDAMQNRTLADKLTLWFTRRGKKDLPVIFLPTAITQQYGVPQEILDIIDSRRIVSDLCKIFYLILETMGVYMLNDKVTQLVSDHY